MRPLPTLEAVHSDITRDPRLLGTETRLDGGGGGRDTDASQNLPLQTLASASVDVGEVEPTRYSHDGSAPVRLPSLILTFADGFVPTDISTRASGTETFQRGAGGGRDSDIESLAAATTTKLADPTARDTDIEQLDFAAIGQRNAY